MPNKYKNLEKNIHSISDIEDPRTKNLIFGQYAELLRTEEGLCFGLVFMWGHAVLLKDEKTFFDRLNLLTYDFAHKPLEMFGQIWNKLGKLMLACTQMYISNVRTNPHYLEANPNVALIISIRAFLDGLLLYHDPHATFLHKDKIHKNFLDQDPIAASTQLGHGLVSVFKILFVGSKVHFLGLFQNMVSDLSISQSQPTFISIEDHSHCIGAILNPTRCVVFDPNHLSENFYLWEIQNRLNTHYMLDDFSNKIFEVFDIKLTDIEPTRRLCVVLRIWTLEQCRTNFQFTRTNQWYRQFYLRQMISSGRGYRRDFFNHLTEIANDDPTIVDEFLNSLHEDELDCLEPVIFVEACQEGNFNFVRAILAHLEKFRFDLNRIYIDGFGPLHWAARNGHANIVNALLSISTIDPNALQRGFTPLHWACTKNRTEVVKVFLSPQHRSKIKIDDPNDPHPPLEIACKNAADEIILLLLTHGARVRPGMIKLYRAYSRAKPEILQRLQLGH